MSRFQPHVSRDRDTSKGKSDFANVLTEGWANIFEPFVPLVCTVTSSEGGGYVEAPLRGHIFSFFFFFPPPFFFLPFFHSMEKQRRTTRVRKTMRVLCVDTRERRLKNVRCRRWKTRGMKLLFHLISGEMAILIAPRSDELKNSVFENPLLDVRLTGWKKGEKGKGRNSLSVGNLVKIDGIARNEERVTFRSWNASETSDLTWEET